MLCIFLERLPNQLIQLIGPFSLSVNHGQPWLTMVNPMVFGIRYLKKANVNDGKYGGESTNGHGTWQEVGQRMESF